MRHTPHSIIQHKLLPKTKVRFRGFLFWMRPRSIRRLRNSERGTREGNMVWSTHLTSRQPPGTIIAFYISWHSRMRDKVWQGSKFPKLWFPDDDIPGKRCRDHDGYRSKEERNSVRLVEKFQRYIIDRTFVHGIENLISSTFLDWRLLLHFTNQSFLSHRKVENCNTLTTSFQYIDGRAWGAERGNSRNEVACK